MKKTVIILSIFLLVMAACKTQPPAAASYSIVAVFAGTSNIFVFPNDSTVMAAGYNQSGQLGINQENSRIVWEMSRVRLGDQDKPGPIAVAAGENHTVLIAKDGVLWGAGASWYGELGQGENNNGLYPVFTPLKDGNGNSINNVKAAAAGSNSTFIIKNDNSLWAAGHNYYGELGLGDRNNHFSFTQVTGAGQDVKDVAAGARHTVILKNDGTLWAAGYNFNGQLGFGDADASQFTLVNGVSSVAAVAAGNYHTVLLKNDGTVWVAGENYYGQLGNNGDGQRSFVQVKDAGGKAITDATAIAAGGDLTVILRKDGSLLMAGTFDEPEYDIESGPPPPLAGEPECTLVPLQTDNKARLDVKQIVIGSRSIYVLTADGHVWTAGSNQYGQLIMGSDVKDSAVLKLVYPKT